MRALVYSGLLCIAFFTLVPVAFQGYLGLNGLLDPSIYDGTGVGKVMTQMVGQVRSSATSLSLYSRFPFALS